MQKSADAKKSELERLSFHAHTLDNFSFRPIVVAKMPLACLKIGDLVWLSILFDKKVGPLRTPGLFRARPGGKNK